MTAERVECKPPSNVVVVWSGGSSLVKAKAVVWPQAVCSVSFCEVKTGKSATGAGTPCVLLKVVRSKTRKRNLLISTPVLLV